MSQLQGSSTPRLSQTPTLASSSSTASCREEESEKLLPPGLARKGAGGLGGRTAGQQDSRTAGQPGGSAGIPRRESGAGPSGRCVDPGGGSPPGGAGPGGGAALVVLGVGPPCAGAGGGVSGEGRPPGRGAPRVPPPRAERPARGLRGVRDPARVRGLRPQGQGRRGAGSQWERREGPRRRVRGPALSGGARRRRRSPRGLGADGCARRQRGACVFRERVCGPRGPRDPRGPGRCRGPALPGSRRRGGAEKAGPGRGAARLQGQIIWDG